MGQQSQYSRRSAADGNRFFELLNRVIMHSLGFVTHAKVERPAKMIGIYLQRLLTCSDRLIVSASEVIGIGHIVSNQRRKRSDFKAALRHLDSFIRSAHRQEKGRI